jgi:hypothetical protein
VATIAFDSDYEGAAAKPPISLHPAFPAIVALWFAALLGIGSLVLPAVLLDRVVTATGIASFIPSAAPPLGMTARSIIALAGALVGAGLGVSIARRVARSHQPDTPSRVTKLAGGSRRPISVKDELGGEGVINGHGQPLTRRRALAISEDDRPSDFLYQVPIPGGDPDAPPAFAPPPEAPPVPAEEPLELSELAETDPAPSPFAELDPAAQPEEEEQEAREDFAMTERQEFKSAWPTEQHYPRGSRPADERDRRKNGAGPRGLEPLPFSPPSLARRAAEVEVEPEPEFEPEPDLELEAVPAAAVPEIDEPEYRADWQTAPLDGLGLVQLVQRLGSTIERRREWIAQAPAASIAPAAAPFAAAPADFEPAEPEEAAQAMAAFFGANEPAEARESEQPATELAPAPEALRPDFLRALPEEEDDEDDVPDFSLPLRRPVAATVSFSPPAEEQDNGEAEEEASEAGYSSLLGLANPFAAPKNEFVRIEEPEEDAAMAEPTVVFPGQEEPARVAEPAPPARMFDPPGKGVAPVASAPPADADAALRAALATLQRMSGAA